MVPLVLLLLLAILFKAITTAAGDNFCPNLNTISKMLKLSENVAGVTLLALGNGAPDLIATFQAMSTGRYGLAIGELVGAATFITTVVVGAVAIKTGFKVTRRPFLRDVLFFLGAIAFLLFALWDSKITLTESLILVCYYIVYVLSVTVGRWIHERRKRHVLSRLERERESARQAQISANNLIQQAENHLEDSIGSDLEQQSLLSAPSTRRLSGLSRRLFLQEPTEDIYQPAFYKYSALSSLKPGAFQLRHHDDDDDFLSEDHHSQGGRSSRNKWLPLRERSSESLSHHPRKFGEDIYRSTDNDTDNDDGDGSTDQEEEEKLLEDVIAHDTGASAKTPLINNTLATRPEPIPFVNVVDDGPNEAQRTFNKLPSNVPFFPSFRSVLGVLFRSLQDFYTQSILGKILSVLAIIPSFLLTITIPIVDIEREEEEQKVWEVEFLIFQRDTNQTVSSVTNAPPLPWTHFWLSLLHSFLVPPFLVHGLSDMFTGEEMTITAIVVAVILSLASGGVCLTWYLRKRAKSEPVTKPAWFKYLAVFGFLAAMIWIYRIAAQVLAILQAMGLIFGISDAVLGLTIFAIGNSLADLVADLAIANMGFPNMAIAACFGSPMLNLLLGIGLSSFYFTATTGDPYKMVLTPTLLTSSIGLIVSLVSSLVLVPFNGWRGKKTYGYYLIGVYVTIMAVNLFVATTTSKQTPV